MANLRTEQRQLRARMHAAKVSTHAIAIEFGRRYRLRPRAAWRHANGWSLTEAAEKINSCAHNAGLHPSGLTVAMTSGHLCEHEAWPGEGSQPVGRRVKPSLLALLACTYGATIPDLLDLRDYEELAPADRLLIDILAQNAGHGRPPDKYPDRIPY